MSTGPIQTRELAGLFEALAGCRRVGLAVSGGADSMALMHLAVRWRDAAPGRRPALSVLTVDHGLRAGSGEEAAWVERAAAALGLPATVLRWSGPKPATGVQQAARAARYDRLAVHARTHGLDAVATAHHLDDQAETVLMRLARGSGVDGLAAMAPQREWAGLRLVRPLLDVPKARLVATLEAAGVGWLEDPSNADERFERVRLRRALNLLAREGLSAEALALTARRMRRAAAALEAEADRFLASHVRFEAAGYAHLDLAPLLVAAEETALRALARVLAAVGGQEQGPRLARLEALLARLQAEKDLTRTLAGCRLAVRRERLFVVREPGRKGLPRLALAPGQAALWDRRFLVHAPAWINRPLTVGPLTPAGWRAIREQAPAATVLPEGAAGGVAAFWDDDRLVAVPPLGYAALPAEDEGHRSGCTAVFVAAQRGAPAAGSPLRAGS